LATHIKKNYEIDLVLHTILMGDFIPIHSNLLYIAKAIFEEINSMLA